MSGGSLSTSFRREGEQYPEKRTRPWPRTQRTSRRNRSRGNSRATAGTNLPSGVPQTQRRRGSSSLFARYSAKNSKPYPPAAEEGESPTFRSRRKSTVVRSLRLPHLTSPAWRGLDRLVLLKCGNDFEVDYHAPDLTRGERRVTGHARIRAPSKAIASIVSNALGEHIHYG
jgi:hypothetical protein